jgi:hypothetical protein
MDDNLLYLQQLAMSSSGPQGYQGPQGPRGFDGANGSDGVQGPTGLQGPIGQGVTGTSGDIYFATFSGVYTIPDVGYLLELALPSNLAYSSGQYVIVYNDIDSFWVEDDYDDDSTYSSKIEGEVEWYDHNTGTMSVLVTYAQQVGTTASYWYINLTGARGQGDEYFATSDTYMPIPDIENIVVLSTQKNLAYTPGQWVVVYNNTGGFYVDNDYDDDDVSSSIFYGEIETYDPVTGSMSIVTESSLGVGATYSNWVINLSGNMGPQGPSYSGGSGSIGSTGPQGPIGPQGPQGIGLTGPVLYDNSNVYSIDINNRLLDDENGTHAVLWNTSNSTLRYSGTTKFDWKNLAMPTLGGSGKGLVAIDNSGNLSHISNPVVKYQRDTPPSAGGSYSISDGYSLYLNLNANGDVTGTYSVYLPPNPLDGQIVHIVVTNDNMFKWNMYNLEIIPNAGQTIDNSAPTQSLWPNRSCSFMFTSDAIWARLT